MARTPTPPVGSAGTGDDIFSRVARLEQQAAHFPREEVTQMLIAMESMKTRLNWLTGILAFIGSTAIVAIVTALQEYLKR